MSTEIDELREKCQHPLISERRAAISRLAELMENPTLKSEAQVVLEDRVKNDTVQNMRSLASSILDRFQDYSSVPTKPERQHTFEVFCPYCKNVCCFDKREVCSKVEIYRSSDEEEQDELYLKCTKCGEPLKVKVNCEEYK